MPIEALLLSRDSDALRVLRRVLDELSIQILVSTGAAEAEGILSRRKFDAVVFDCDGVAGAADVLKRLRQGTSNKAAIVFALVSGTTTTRVAFDLGANFVLEKPLTTDRVQRSFRAAHGLMLRERRRYFRLEVEIPVTLDFDGNVFRGSIKNLSEGGLAVHAPRELPKTGNVRANFMLPSTTTSIDARGEVAWNTGDRAGIRILFINENMKIALATWLAQAVERPETAPQPTGADRFAKPGK